MAPRRPAPKKAPRTPARGSSPVTPPGGSARRPVNPGRYGQTPPSRPAGRARPSPAAAALLEKRRQQPQRAPQRPVAPPQYTPGVPQPRAPVPPVMGPQRVPPAVAQNPENIAAAAQPGNTFIGGGYTPEEIAAARPQGTPLVNAALAGMQAVLNPPSAMKLPVANFMANTAERLQNIGAPVESFTPPPAEGEQRVGALLPAAGQPATSNWAVQQNPDGSTDWVGAGLLNSGQTAPRTRQQAPGLLTRLGRATGALGWSALEAVGVPAQVAGVAAGALTQGGAKPTAPVILPGGKVYTPQQTAMAPGMQPGMGPGQFGAVGGTALQTALFGMNPTSPNAALPDIARQFYGDTPEVAQALQFVNNISYSTPESKLKAVARMVEFGEEPNAAMFGNPDYIESALLDQGYLDDPLAAIKRDPLAAYVYETLKAEGQTDAQILDTFNTQGLPGEMDLGREIVGQSVFDPLNAISGPGAAVDEAMKTRKAARWFAPSQRTLAETLDTIRRSFRPTGNAVLDALIPTAKTPAAARAQVVELAADSTSLILSEAGKLAGKVDPLTGKPRPTLFTVVEALVNSAAPAPVRANFDSVDEFELATRAWRATVDNANAVLSPFRVAGSDAGRLGAAITREILTDDTGKLSTQLVRNLLDTSVPLHERLGALLTRYERAAEALLDPARASVRGSETAAQWAKRTGQAISEFPVFERGFAGAQEAHRAGKPLAAWQYPLLAAADFRGWVNNGLWHLFATFNPAYSFRNAANNLVTAVIDGHLGLASRDEVLRFNAEVLGAPTAAGRGIGTAGTHATEAAGPATRGGSLVGKGFAGDLRLRVGPINIPLGAQAIEETFSQRIVYSAARKYLDKMLVLGRAIPELPDEVVRGLGQDAVRALVNEIRRTSGDVDSALALVKKVAGTYDTWRYMADDAAEALMEFDPDINGRVFQALIESETPEALRAAFRDIRRDVRAALDLAEDSVPAFGASQSEMAAAYADDLELARALGQSPDPDDFMGDVTGAWLDGERAEAVARDAVTDHLGDAPGPNLFDEQVRLDQQARDAAEDAATQAARQSRNPAAIDDWFDTRQRVNTRNKAARAAHEALRKKAWADSSRLNNLKLNKNVVAQRQGALWAKYRQQRDAIWQGFREFAVDEWGQLAGKYGVPFADNVPASAADEAAEGLRQFEQAAEAEARADVVGGTLANEMTAQDVKRIFRAGSTTTRPEAKTLWTRQVGGRTEWLAQRNPPKGTKVGRWNGNVREWHRTPASEVDEWVEQVYESLGGDRSSGLDATQMWDEIVRAYRNRGRVVRGPNIPNIPSGAANIPTPPATAVPGGPPAQVFDQGPNAPLRFGQTVDMGAPTAVPGGPQAVPLPPVRGGQLGFAEAPIPRRWTPADPRSILSVLDEIEQAAVRGWGHTRINHGWTEQAQAAFELWAAEARAQLGEHRALASRVGVEARNFALLDYADRRNLDTLLSFVMPYHYWYGRTYKNWLQRGVLNPAVLANYQRYRGALEQMHSRLPEWQRQQLSTDDLGLSLDTPLMFNLEATLSPLYGVLGADFSSPERRRAQLFGMQMGAFAEDMAAFGPSVWAPVIWAMAWDTYRRGDPESANAWVNNYLGSTGRALRSASALVEEWSGRTSPIPAGGVNLDPQMFLASLASGNTKDAFGLSATTPWEEERIAKILTGMMQTPPQGMDPAEWQAQLMEAGYTRTGPLWDQAKQQMFAETAPAVLASYGLGVGFKGRAAEDVEFTQIWNEVGLILEQSADLEPEALAQAWLDLEKRHPLAPLLMITRGGRTQRDDAWVWEAYGRVGPSNSQAWPAAGVSQAALDAFFAAKGTAGMDPALRDELLAGAIRINDSFAPVSVEEQQRRLEAKQHYAQVLDDLENKYGPDVFGLQDDYYAVLRQGGPDAASAWLESQSEGARGTLFELWADKTEMLAADPNASAYYVGPEQWRSKLIGDFYDEMEVQYPGVLETNTEYKKLRQSGDNAAANLMKEEHPELVAFWEARTAFYDKTLPKELKAWLRQRPKVEMMNLRPGAGVGLAEQLVDYAQEDAAKMMGATLTELGGGDVETGTDDGSVSMADYYRQRIADEAAARLADEGYLNAENRDAYGAGVLEPIIRGLGPLGAAEWLEQPFAGPDGQPAPWQPTQYGLQGVLAFVGEAGSFREALLAHATQDEYAQWPRYVAALAAMPDEQLQQLARQYPQLADAALVAEQARGYPGPSLAVLHDLLGFSVSIREDGTYSITRESVKLNKKGEAYPTTDGSRPQTRAGGGGGAGRGFYSQAVTGEAPSRGRGRGRRSGGGGGGGYAPGPAPEQAAAESWQGWMGEMKLNDPALLTAFTDYLDMLLSGRGDVAGRLLAENPALAQLLQQMGAEQLAALQQGYAAWRLMQGGGLDREQERAYSQRVDPSILRVYNRRPSRAGLPG